MKLVTLLLVLSVVSCGGAPGGIDPQLFVKYEAGNEKLGQVYYEQVCTACHKKQLGHAVSPSDKLSQDWDAFFTINRHGDNAEISGLNHFFSQAYRKPLVSEIEVIQVYQHVPAEDLQRGVYKFVILGAKDSDMPHTCQ